MDSIYTGSDRLEAYLAHHGILGMHWGVRRYRNKDGSLTAKGKARLAKKEIKSIRNDDTSNIASKIKKLDEYAKSKDIDVSKAASKAQKELKRDDARLTKKEIKSIKKSGIKSGYLAAGTETESAMKKHVSDISSMIKKLDKHANSKDPVIAKAASKAQKELRKWEANPKLKRATSRAKKGALIGAGITAVLAYEFIGNSHNAMEEFFKGFTDLHRKKKGLAPLKRNYVPTIGLGVAKIVDAFSHSDLEDEAYLAHHGILGMHWGVRRYRPYPDGYSGSGKEVGEAAKKKPRKLSWKDAKHVAKNIDKYSDEEISDLVRRLNNRNNILDQLQRDKRRSREGAAYVRSTVKDVVSTFKDGVITYDKLVNGGKKRKD